MAHWFSNTVPPKLATRERRGPVPQERTPEERVVIGETLRKRRMRKVHAGKNTYQSHSMVAR